MGKTISSSTEYPEHEKLHAIKDKSQVIGEFLEWLNNKHGYIIAYYPELEKGEVTHVLVPVYRNTNDLLADYYSIDLDLVEREKLAMLDKIREMNKTIKLVPTEGIIDGKKTQKK